MRSPDRQASFAAELLRLARGSIEYGLEHREPMPLRHATLRPEFREPGATFTTLRRDGELRGCCGRLEAVQPLASDVVQSAFRAAFEDPRFTPLCGDELEVVQVEVSVLSPLEDFPVSDEADLLDRLTPGTDGLVILAAGRRATFLPTVWESLPDPRAFLASLKAKCGLPRDYWSERLEFQRYRTTSYGETASSMTA